MEEEIGENMQLFLYIEEPAIKESVTGESTEKLTLFYNETAELWLGELMCYEPKLRNESYMYNTIMLIDRMDL